MPKKERSLKDFITDALQRTFGLTETDVKSKPGNIPGEDIILSIEARKTIGNIHIECKDQERLNFWDAIKKAKQNAGSYNSVLIFRRNRKGSHVIIEYEFFQRLLILASTKRKTQNDE